MPDIHRNSETVKRIVRIACVRHKVSICQLAVMLGYTRAGGRVGLTKGRVTTLPHFLRLTRYAGIADSRATAIWCKLQIPETHAHLKRFVGCTVRRWAAKKVPVNPEQEAANAMLAELLRNERMGYYEE